MSIKASSSCDTLSSVVCHAPSPQLSDAPMIDKYSYPSHADNTTNSVRFLSVPCTGTSGMPAIPPTATQRPQMSWLNLEFQDQVLSDRPMSNEAPYTSHTANTTNSVRPVSIPATVPEIPSSSGLEFQDQIAWLLQLKRKRATQIGYDQEPTKSGLTEAFLPCVALPCNPLPRAPPASGPLCEALDQNRIEMPEEQEPCRSFWDLDCPSLPDGLNEV
jgi:hypothetical protein